MQGYYFVFLSLQALSSIFLPLMSQVLVVHLSSVHENTTHNDHRKEEVSSLISFGFVTYLSLASILASILVFLGLLFFDEKDKDIWKMAWILLCVINFFEFMLDFFVTVFEGLREVKHVYFLRMIRSLIYGGSLIALIFFNFNLTSIVLAKLIAISVGVYYLYHSFYKTHKDYFRLSLKDYFFWARKILPWQLKVTTVSVAGYCSVTLITPLVFKLLGTEEAARVGLLLSLIGVMIALTFSFFQTKISIFSRFVADKNFVDLDKLAIRQSKYLIGSFVILSSLLLFSIYIANFFNLDVANRIANFQVSFLFILGAIFGSFTQPVGHYLRCYKKEPLFLISITYGFSVPIFGYFLASKFGALGFASSYCVLNIFLLFPVSVAILIKFGGSK